MLFQLTEPNYGSIASQSGCSWEEQCTTQLCTYHTTRFSKSIDKTPEIYPTHDTHFTHCSFNTKLEGEELKRSLSSAAQSFANQAVTDKGGEGLQKEEEEIGRRQKEGNKMFHGFPTPFANPVAFYPQPGKP